MANIKIIEDDVGRFVSRQPLDGFVSRREILIVLNIRSCK